MTRLILVRHGQTTWNSELKYQGHTDTELSALGIEQAKIVARRLAKYPIAGVYASDLSRAYQTAEHIAAVHGLPVCQMPELREIKFGDWEGLTYEAVRQKWPEMIDRFFSFADEIKIPGGESFSQLKERAMSAIVRLTERHKGETAVIVSHGGTIRTIICAALNIHLNYVWNIRQDNTAVNIIEYYPERAIVTLLNDVHHLEEKGNLQK
ncbi:MAG: alpha-ribazole phosphatase [Negativicutes bacterium]|nr:alpha-ribazole phosphatase [Negativicutes bacterium]